MNCDNTIFSYSPLFSYNCYKRVLISSAATSALRLHQRLPVSTVNVTTPHGTVGTLSMFVWCGKLF